MKTTKRVSYDKIVIHRTWTDDNGVFHATPSSEEVVSYDNDIDVPDLTEQERQDGKTVDIQFVTGASAVGSVVSAVVNTSRGELQLNKNRGIPYLDAVLGAKSQDQVSDWAAFTQEAILGTNGVKGINSFSYGIEKVAKRRVLTYSAEIATDYGEITIGEETSPSTVREIRHQEPTIPPNVDNYTMTKPVLAHEGAGSANAATVYPNKPGVGRVLGIEYSLTATGEAWTSEIPDTAGTYKVRALVENTVRFDAGYVTSDAWTFEVYAATVFTLTPTATSGKTATIRMTTTDGGFVLWGDGSRSDISGSGTQYATHAYSDYGSYNVFVVGATWFAIGNGGESGASDGTVLMVTGLSMWASDLKSAAYTFAGCANLVQNTIPAWPDGMTSVAHCYEGCVGLGAESEI